LRGCDCAIEAKAAVGSAVSNQIASADVSEPIIPATCSSWVFESVCSVKYAYSPPQTAPITVRIAALVQLPALDASPKRPQVKAAVRAPATVRRGS
jgi:hypothetical protein